MAKIINITERGDIEIMDDVNFVLLSSSDLERIDTLLFEREAARRHDRHYQAKEAINVSSG